MGCTSSLGTTTIAPGCDPPITVASTSICIGGVLTSYVALATIGAVSVVGSQVRPVINSSITTITGCSATSKGVP